MGAPASRNSVVERGERAGPHLGERPAPSVALIELHDHAQEGPQAVDGHRQVMRLGEPQSPGRPAGRGERVEAAVLVEALEQIEQHRQEIDARAVEVDAELEAEPAGALFARLDARVPGGVALDDAERVLRVDLDAPAERAPLRERPRREGAERVLVAVGPDHVVGRRTPSGGAIASTHASSTAPSRSMTRRAAASPARSRSTASSSSRRGTKDARPHVARAHARAAVVEEQLDERNEHLVEIARQAIGARDEDLVCVEPHTGYEGRIDGSGTVGGG